MAHILKLTEWESAGRWHCADTSDLVGGSAFWWLECRCWNKTPAEFVKMLVEEYKVDHISYNYERNVLLWSWSSQSAMRKYKNAINKVARDRSFMV